MMKHLWLALIILCSIGMLFHSGRTDEDGGHTDSSTGEYHYHHGYPAHQHPDGKCPYEDQEPIYTHHESGNTGEDVRTQSQTQINRSSEKESKWKNVLWAVSPFAIVGGGIAMFKGVEKLGDIIIEKRHDRLCRKRRGE